MAKYPPGYFSSQGTSGNCPVRDVGVSVASTLQSQLARCAGELPQGRAVVTVCRSGARPARAAALPARDGREVSNLSGGIHAWARAGLPVVAKGGAPGHIA